MRFAFASLLLGLSVLSSGCILVEDATHNTLVALRTPIAEHREAARNRRWAEETWGRVCSMDPMAYTIDYGHGFKDGYAEYLFRGGDGEPPLVAPPRYRHLKDQTPAGFAAIQDWFNGYRHGASIARESGARQWITGPSALHAPPPGSDTQTAAPPLREMHPQAQVLAPKPADPGLLNRQTVQPGKEPVESKDVGHVIIQLPPRSPLPHETVLPSVAPRESRNVDNVILELPSPAPPATSIRIIGISTASPEVEPAPARARITGITSAPVK